MKKKYDIIVIGAGPAGLNASLNALKTNPSLSLLLIDKVLPWEKPIPCAEGVGRLGFEQALDVKPEWIRQVINKATFHAPNGTAITYNDSNKGFIIDRVAMQRDLAAMIIALGGSTLFNKKVVNISIPSGDQSRTILLDDGSFLECRVVIDASGPISLLGKNEKICWKPQDLEPAYFAVAENVEVERDSIHLYMGKQIAPGGYAWVFPRGNESANIGIVIGKEFRNSVNMHSLLDIFIENNFKNAKILQKHAGPIPCGYQRGLAALPGFIKTGDAASTINPISRAGISEALLSGLFAGNCAALMCVTQSEKELTKLCKNYENQWYKQRGMRHIKLAKVKKSLFSIPDDDYNRAAEALSKIHQNELTMAKIFAKSLGRFPRLVWALRHLM